MTARPSILLTRRWPVEVEAHLAERYAVTIRDPDSSLGREALKEAMRAYDALCPTVSAGTISPSVSRTPLALPFSPSRQSTAMLVRTSTPCRRCSAS